MYYEFWHISFFSPVVNFLIKRSYPDFEVKHLRVPVIYLSALNVNASDARLFSPGHTISREWERKRGKQFINCSAHNWISAFVFWDRRMTQTQTRCCCFFSYIFLSIFALRIWNETEADQCEREADCALICRFHLLFFCTFSLTFCFLAQRARGRAYVIPLILIGNKRPPVSLSLSLPATSLLSLNNEKCMCYKKPKAHLSCS